jgi:malonyl CoA-acyl carrier protein transacylase
MAPAAARVKEAMEGVSVSTLTVPLLSNGEMVQDAARVRSLLIERITQPVLFHVSLLNSQTILADRPTSYVELGAGSVLSGLASKFAESETLDVPAVALPTYDAVRHFLAACQAPPSARAE